MRAFDPANFTPPPRAPGGNGPFLASLFAAIICAALLVTLRLGLKLNLTIFFVFVIPAVTAAVLLVASSMGWVFLMIGRSHRQPRKLPATIAMICIAMLELLAIIVICGQTTGQ